MKAGVTMKLIELAEGLKRVDRSKLTVGQQKALSGYKSMIRNIKEDGYIGGESGVSEHGISQAIKFLEKHSD